MELHKPYLFVNERKGQLLKIDDYKFIRVVCSLIKTMMDLIMNRGREKNLPPLCYYIISLGARSSQYAGL